MNKDQAKALTDQMEAGIDEALEVVAHFAQRAKYVQAHITSSLEKTQALLAAPFEDPADTTVGDITTGPATEQTT